MKKLSFMLVSLLIFVVSMNGQDTLRQRDQTKQGIQKRDRIHQEDHLMLINGKLYHIQNGTRTLVQNPIQLHNGGAINPDGTYQLKNAERMQLRNGECLDFDGNRYQNQKMFNQRHVMTHRQMMQNQNMNMQKNQMKQGRRSGGKSGS